MLGANTGRAMVGLSNLQQPRLYDFTVQSEGKTAIPTAQSVAINPLVQG